MTSRTVSLIALAGALALAACNKADTGANTAAADNMAVIDNDAAAVPPEDLALPAGDTAVVEDASTAPAIQTVEVPTPDPSTPDADAAPLTDALAAQQLIDAGTGITRVQQADGWAWMQNGQIIRTASADGHRVSYFKRGSTTPYFVQQDGRSYAYDNGRVAHEYDDHGRVRAPDAQHQREAQQFADQAHQQHYRAQQASKTAPHIDRGRDHGNVAPTANHSPQPQPSSSDHNAPDRGHDGGNDRGTSHANPHPTPTPSPSPSHDNGSSSNGRNDHRGGQDDSRSNGH
ncbi:MAG: hypothetical protein ACTHM8_15365 [Sphingomonas sp.]